ncbi:alpha/beta hydrolase [Curtobacterium ammoniigenes]|uniref:alpha/beta hydrolase n=1 Tax=Curtobacterium ammoniigenes TaxID=395387 RepID=UPI0008359571|nr:alpha/beta hydrolase [Curtobacterium ammoniigenes]
MTDSLATAVEDHTLDGPHGPLRVRIYRPASPTGPGLLWLHGGGFLAGDIDMAEGDAVARGFAERGIAVVSLDYRLAPQEPDDAGNPGHDGVHYPVPVDETVFAYRWVLDSGLASGSWAIGGASAGGNLAAAASLRLAHDGSAPALAVLAYPTLLAVQPEPDAELRAALGADPAADRFGPSAVAWMYENYLGGPVDNAPIYAVPGRASRAELESFPPTIMINDEVDELRISGEAFAASLRDAGVEIDVSTEPGTLHGHLNRPGTDAWTATIDRCAERINRLAG